MRVTKKRWLRTIKSKEFLEKLSTPRLLAYKNARMKVPETPYWDDLDGFSKSDPDWKAHIEMVKGILNTRENV